MSEISSLLLALGADDSAANLNHTFSLFDFY